jgi:hypothetical protein
MCGKTGLILFVLYNYHAIITTNISEDFDRIKKFEKIFVNQLFDSRQGQGFFLFATTSRPAVGPTQLPIRALSPGGKVTGTCS